MANNTQNQKRIKQAENIHKLDVDNYLVIREQLARDIPEIFAKMNAFANDEEFMGKKITKGQYDALKHMYTLYLTEMKDPDAPFKKIMEEAEKEQRPKAAVTSLSGEDIANSPVTFSKTAQ